MYTHQTAFNKIYKHMKQAESMCMDSEEHVCLFYGANGARCAVGVLIPEDQYHVDLEGTVLRKVMAQVPALQGLEYEFLQSAQNVHDEPINWSVRRGGATFRARGLAELAEIAKRWDLTVPE